MMNKFNVNNKKNKGNSNGAHVSATAAIALAVLLAIAPLITAVGVANATSLPNTKEGVLATQQLSTDTVDNVNGGGLGSSTVQSRWSEVGVVEPKGVAVLMADCLPGEIPTMPQFHLAENVGISLQTVVGIENFLTTAFVIQNYGDEKQAVAAGVLCMDVHGSSSNGGGSNSNNHHHGGSSTSNSVTINNSIKIKIISIVQNIVNNYNINKNVTIISNQTTVNNSSVIIAPIGNNGTVIVDDLGGNDTLVIAPGTNITAPVVTTPIETPNNGTAPVVVVEEQGQSPIANATTPVVAGEGQQQQQQQQAQPAANTTSMEEFLEWQQNTDAIADRDAFIDRMGPEGGAIDGNPRGPIDPQQPFQPSEETVAEEPAGEEAGSEGSSEESGEESNEEATEAGSDEEEESSEESEEEESNEEPEDNGSDGAEEEPSL